MRRLYPDARDEVDPDEAYADPSRRRAGRPWLLVNMIASLDGGTVISGRSGELGGPADKAIFAALRRLADVVLVGSSTVKAESYGAPKEAGQRIAVVTKAAGLDWTSELFQSGAGLVVTVEDGPDLPVPVIRAGTGRVDLGAALAELDAQVVLCEGGPSLNGQLVLDGLVDEICLTVAPCVIAGPSARIVTEGRETLASMRLVHVLEDEGYLFLRYVRP